MSYQIKLDREQMQKVANLLARINPVDTADGFYRTMESMAHQMTKPGYCATGGFYITMFEPSYAKGELHMIVTLMLHTVENYLKTLEPLDVAA